MTLRRLKSGERISLLLAASVLAAFWIAVGTFAVREASRHDFLSFYTGATLAVEGRWSELYDIGAQRAIQDSLVTGLPSLVPYIRPPVYALLVSPLAALEFATALKLWLAVQIILYCAIGFWIRRRYSEEGLLYWALFMPGAAGIMHGQDSTMILAVAAAGLVLSERGRPVAAGLVWSLLFIKFHICAGLALALFAGRKSRELSGFAMGGALLASVSIALVGSAGVASYVAMLTSKDLDRLSPAPQKMTNILGMLATAGIDSAWVALLAGTVVAAAMVAAAWKAPTWRVLAAGLAAGMLIAPHAYIYDVTALLLPLVIAVQHGQPRSLRIVAFLLIAPVIPMMSLAQPPWSVLPALAVTALLAVLAVTRRARQEAEPAPACDAVRPAAC